MEFFVKLNSEAKKTIILVTHEPDIAEYAKRVVTFRDGNIISDEYNKKPKGIRSSELVLEGEPSSSDDTDKAGG